MYCIDQEIWSSIRAAVRIECDYYTNPSGKIGTADEKSSKYYLQIYKVEDDGHNIKGSGTIYN